MTGARRATRVARRAGRVLVAAMASVTLVACGSQGPSGSGGKITVVVTENFWGSIVRQIGGDKIQETSLITNPNADPHDYDPPVAVRREIASANYVIVNGAGYDSKVGAMLPGTPSAHHITLAVGDLVGVTNGGNPHLWYNPTFVQAFVDRVTADLQKLDSTDSNYFDQQKSNFLNNGLSTYNQLLSEIKQRYAHTRVGSTESIFAYMAGALNLDLTTPPEFMNAISENKEPTVEAKTTFDQQITQKQIKVLLFNKQNSTPDVDALVKKARDEKIPVVAITETLAPASASFQDWQSAQLTSLEQALSQGA